MSRKELVLVARGILQEAPMIRARMCVRLGRIFREDNPRFDVQKWVEACGVRHPDIALTKILADV